MWSRLSQVFTALFPHSIAGWKEELDSPWLLAPVHVWWSAAARANQASPPAISHSSASEPLLAFAAECFVVSHCYFLSYLSVLWTFSPRFHWCDFLSNSVNSNLLFPFSRWWKFLFPVIKVSSLHLECQRTGPRGFFTLNSFHAVHPLKYTEVPLDAQSAVSPSVLDVSSPESPPFSLTSPAPGSDSSVSLDLPGLDISNKWNPTTCILLWLTSLA